ncbi:S9 family peptidase [Luteimonas sp. RC10]|uniref:S9 family peptidase n=1 Tax=Luteimonas sp. RC10 TaxID=2587035 RepID=UPI00161A0564|nr:S9 family peptidase [Luteimonas sp. RC10]MBB3343094.1 dipeptidyl aminopeptidase/acylaminoacyl peptidase [Luteimonas sp. RC10]
MQRWIMGIACALVLATGTPAVAARQSAGMTLEQVAQTRTANQAAISPDGSEVAYVLSVPRALGKDPDGPARSELHVVDRAGHDRGFVTGQVDVSAPRWLPDGQSIAYLSKREGDATRRLYTIPLRGGESTAVAHLAGDISSFDLSPDGRRAVLLAAQPEDAARKQLREQGFSQKVYEEDWRPVEVWIAELGGSASPRKLAIDGSVRTVRWSPAGDRLAVVVAPRQLTDDMMVDARVRIYSVEGRELGRVDNPGKLGEIAWSPDGEHLAIISAADANDPSEGRLTVVGKSGGAQRDLLPGLEGHVWHVGWRDASTLVFLSQEGVQSRLAEIGVDGTGQRTLLRATGPVHMGLSVARNGDVALVGSTPAHPSEIFHLAAGSAEPRRLTDSNPWLADVRLARQEIVRYTARDGLELEGLLVHPLERRGQARVPLVVVVHGGPESHNVNGWLNSYAQPAQTLAAQGFASFFPNYRASTGRGVAFSKLDHGRPGMEEFDDLVDGVDHLIDIGLVDRDKVGITGGSYGGYASAWGATYYSERFAASVMFVGISDQASLVTTGDIPREQYQVHMQTWPWESPEMYRQASPITHAQKSRTPTLILHGEADPRVPVMQSYMLYRYLKLASQAPVRLVLYPGEGHGNSRGASRYDYSLRLVQWMRHYLTGPGGEPPAYQLDYALPKADATR